MATNNLKIFDENKGNIMSTQEYSTNAQRLNGVQQGIASSMLQNKTLYQLSLVAYAIGQMMVNNGLDANDDNAVSAFVGNLANTIVQKVVDKASTAEAQAGTDANKFMTPATTRAAINVLKATSSMATAGTDTTHWMTPALVKQMVDNGTKKFNYVRLYNRTFTQTAGEDVTTNLPSTIFNYSDVIIYVKNVASNNMTGELYLLLGTEEIQVYYANNSNDIFLTLHLQTIKDLMVLFRPLHARKIDQGALASDYSEAYYQIFRKSLLQSQGIKYRSVSSNNSYRSTITVSVYGSNQTILPT